MQRKILERVTLLRTLLGGSFSISFSFNLKGSDTHKLDFIKTFLKRIYKETEKKRKISEKREFSLEKNLFWKNSLFLEKILFLKFFSKFSWRKVNKHENGSIGSVRTVERVWRSIWSITSGQKVKREFSVRKRIFQKRFFFRENSLFLRNFSLSLCLFVDSLSKLF